MPNAVLVMSAAKRIAVKPKKPNLVPIVIDHTPYEQWQSVGLSILMILNELKCKLAQVTLAMNDRKLLIKLKSIHQRPAERYLR